MPARTKVSSRPVAHRSLNPMVAVISPSREAASPPRPPRSPRPVHREVPPHPRVARAARPRSRSRAGVLGRPGGAPVEVGDAVVAQLDQMGYRQLDADHVVHPHAFDRRGANAAGDDDDRLPGGDLVEPGGGGAGAEHDQRLAAVVLQRGRSAPGFAATRSDAGQHHRVAGRFGGRVDALDQVAVERLLHLEGHPDQAGPVRRQFRPLIGAVAELIGDRPDPNPSGLGRHRHRA